MTMPWIVYARAGEGDRRAEQEERCRAFLRARGLGPVEVIADTTASGRTPPADRPGADEMLRRIGLGLVAGVVVASFDRWSRSLADLATMRDLCHDQGISFVSLEVGPPIGPDALQLLRQATTGRVGGGPSAN